MVGAPSEAFAGVESALNGSFGALNALNGSFGEVKYPNDPFSA
ncbi:hypothetical protein GCM10022247_30150 [Allokutzneria multivorans]|uniref:Uncharacterized protein n=1 Tax=Allokutzneria multivorans TaxID=1142134 RepID=A0ABP7S4G3_9PSEU